MTTDHEDQTNNRLPEIIDYLRANPMKSVEEAGVHYHIHLPPPPPPPPPPKPTAAEQIIPWIWMALLACIIGSICAFILAVVMVALVVGLIGVALVIALLAYLVRSMNEGQAIKAVSRDQGKRRR